MTQTESASEPPDSMRRGGARTSILRNPYLWAFLIGIIVLTLMRPLLRREPAPPPVLGQLPAFSLTDTGGRPFGSVELAGRVYVADFIFTRCGSICPRLTAAMARLQERYRDRGVDVHLLSITIDPDYDTPDVLRRYGENHGVDPERWTLLTGDSAAITRLVVGGFKLALGEAPQSDAPLIDIAHSGRLVLVDGEGRVRGYYEADDRGLDEVFHRSQHVLREQSR